MEGENPCIGRILHFTFVSLKCCCLKQNLANQQQISILQTGKCGKSVVYI